MGYQQDPSVPPTALQGEVTMPEALREVEQVMSVRTPIRMEYTVTPGQSLSRYLRAMKEKRILGNRCPETGQVLVPPRGVSPVSGRRAVEMVEVADEGYIESFNVTRLPIKGRPDLNPPYISAWVVPDGANNSSICLVAGIEPEEARIGMRVKAVWKPDDELEESAANILYWEPTGEPDVEGLGQGIIGQPSESERTAAAANGPAAAANGTAAAAIGTAAAAVGNDGGAA